MVVAPLVGGQGNTSSSDGPNGLPVASQVLRPGRDQDTQLLECIRHPGGEGREVGDGVAVSTHTNVATWPRCVTS